MNLFSHIKQHISILDVASEYATLKKAGLYYKGCCPFHHERTPSFTVSPHREMFYCFGCHAGGDIISFVAKIEHCSPLEAARQLVERYQIQVPQDVTWEKASHQEEAKKLYYTTCATFARWCHKMLEKNVPAREYLQSRSIDAKSSEQFTIGYCPSDIKSLLTFAQKDGILAQNFIDAHLLLEGRTGLYTPFEERIIFPIKDHLGRCVGFGGRVFKKEDQRAKYYNSHDHEFFNKGSILYGLDRAKKDIAQKEAAFLVEGYTDLITMNQYGFTNTVATLGTACTAEHLKQLSRYAQRLYIMYDGDAAGQNAIMRLVELCWQAAIDPYVIILPQADDPASFLLSGGNLTQKVAQASDIFSFVVNHLSDDFVHKSLQERIAITKKIISLINQIPDPLKRNLLLQQASDAFSLPIETLARGLTHAGSGNTITKTSFDQQNAYQHRSSNALAAGSHKQPVESDHTAPKISQLEKKLFCAILYPQGVEGLQETALFDEDEELVAQLLDSHLKKLFDTLRAHKGTQGPEVSTLFEVLNEEEKALVAQLMLTNGTMSGDEEPAKTDMRSIVQQFYKKQWKKKVHDVKLRVYEAQQQGDQQQVKFLLNDLDTLKKKMFARGIA